MQTFSHEFMTQPMMRDPGPTEPRQSHRQLSGPTDSRPGSQTVLLEHPVKPSTSELLMVVCVDISGSMDSQCGPSSRLDVAKQAFCTAAAQTARRDPQALYGVVAFNTQAHAVAQPVVVGTNTERICTAIQSLTADGGTRLDRGLAAAGAMFRRHPERTAKSVLILTDGHSWGEVEEEALSLKRQGVQVFVTGVGDHPSDVNEPLLRSIASVIDGQSAYAFVTNMLGVRSTVLMHTQMASRC